MTDGLARLTNDFQWHIGEGSKIGPPTRRLKKNPRLICPQNIACKNFSGYTYHMTGLGFLMMYDGKDEDLLKIIGICFIIDFTLVIYFLWAITIYRMWAVYLINLVLDALFLAVDKKIYKWDKVTYISSLVPDIFWLVMALIPKFFW